MSAGERIGRVAPFVVVGALTWMTVVAQLQGTAPAVPEGPVRGGEQTFLTYPEWFLVSSPDEYARLIAEQPPSEFPYLGHIGQFWQGYREVTAATRDEYPFNGGYHAMILVIGASTTVEYGLKALYELCVGRFTAQVRGAAPTDEDRLAARVAREYVDFIRARPWYEFDFGERLSQVWTSPLPREALSLRAWERRYALTTEYGAKALYGWLIMAATRASYDPTVPLTRTSLDALPADLAGHPEIQVVSRGDDGVVVDLPRYQAFTGHARALARRGLNFRAIAGNRGRIVLSVVVPRAWQLPPDPTGAQVLFVQPILTDPASARFVLVTTVPELAATLRALDRPSVLLEHVYDY